MIYIFEDGRILYDESQLEKYTDAYIAIDKFPIVEQKENMFISYFANLETGKVDWKYEEIPLEPEPEPIPEPTPIPEPQLSEMEQAILQTAINTEYLMILMETTI